MEDDVSDEYAELCERCGGEMFEYLSEPMADGNKRLRHQCTECGHEWTQGLDGSESWNEKIGDWWDELL